MKQKVLIISLLIVAVLAVIGFLLFQHQQVKGFQLYSDGLNKVKFSYPQSWQVSSTPGFVDVFQNPTNNQALKMIITVNPTQSLAEIYGFPGSDTQDLKIGNKSLKIMNKSIPVPGQANVTLTDIFWLDQNQRYIFEITPGQKNGLDVGMVKVIQTFQAF